MTHQFLAILIKRKKCEAGTLTLINSSINLAENAEMKANS